MTVNHPPGPRRLRAALVGFGLDSDEGPRRILSGRDSFAVGGSAKTHSELAELMIRLELELERRGVGLADVHPDDLAEIACHIDSPELLEIALRLGDELEAQGVSFDEATAEELTRLCTITL
jgi:hypothetical protein